jgi:hypothetical protein
MHEQDGLSPETIDFCVKLVILTHQNRDLKAQFEVCMGILVVCLNTRHSPGCQGVLAGTKKPHPELLKRRECAAEK